MSMPKRDIKRTTLKIRKDVLPKIREQSKRLGYGNYSDFLLFAIDLIDRSEGVLPQITSSLIFDKEKPVILSGEPGVGKSFCLRNLLSQTDRPILVIDVANEYESAGLKPINQGEVFQIDWSATGRYRFVPDPNLQVSRSQVHIIASHLNQVKTQPQTTKYLKDWIIVIEEAHRFSEDSEIRALIAEGRKFVKVVVITSDYRLYRGLGECVMPPPWQTDDNGEL